jgi:hypothetical protein
MTHDSLNIEFRSLVEKKKIVMYEGDCIQGAGDNLDLFPLAKRPMVETMHSTGTEDELKLKYCLARTAK